MAPVRSCSIETVLFGVYKDHGADYILPNAVDWARFIGVFIFIRRYCTLRLKSYIFKCFLFFYLFIYLFTYYEYQSLNSDCNIASVSRELFVNKLLGW